MWRLRENNTYVFHFLEGTIYKSQNTSLINLMFPKLSFYLIFALKISSPALLWY